ncbi:MAG: DUF1569 domain-containing protein [Flavobacteriaceae bacterium]|nr:DUF1569 domain-containing protein [Flavobacteriaceae bacterium]MDZ4148602.1 DUF1569 domain-containing protein [Flavobacteriaceae bacterium]
MNLFDKNDFETIQNRIKCVTEKSVRQWGVMTNAQMLAHCSKVLELALNNREKQIFLGKLLGAFILKKILNNKGATRKNIKSSKKLFVEIPEEFDAEKTRLLELFTRFHKNGSAYYENKLHPFFGRLTSRQWNDLMFRHLDHHLTQFGA